jgi:hypothetical protein
MTVSDVRISIKDMFKRSTETQLMSATQRADRAESRKWNRQLQLNAAAERAKHQEGLPPDIKHDILTMCGFWPDDPLRARVRTMAAETRSVLGLVKPRAVGMVRENSRLADKAKQEIFKNLGI